MLDIKKTSHASWAKFRGSVSMNLHLWLPVKSARFYGLQVHNSVVRCGMKLDPNCCTQTTKKTKSYLLEFDLCLLNKLLFTRSIQVHPNGQHAFQTNNHQAGWWPLTFDPTIPSCFEASSRVFWRGQTHPAIGCCRRKQGGILCFHLGHKVLLFTTAVLKKIINLKYYHNSTKYNIMRPGISQSDSTHSFYCPNIVVQHRQTFCVINI